MKTKFVVALTTVLLGLSAETQAQHSLTVIIKNVKSKAGSMVIGLFNKKESFPKDGQQLKKLKVKVTGNEVQYTFADLPKGDYALAVYQDENDDRTCNTNYIGYPTEGFGFSNNVKPRLSAPSFSQTKVALEESKSIVIQLLR